MERENRDGRRGEVERGKGGKGIGERRGERRREERRGGEERGKKSQTGLLVFYLSNEKVKKGTMASTNRNYLCGVYL